MTRLTFVLALVALGCAAGPAVHVPSAGGRSGPPRVFNIRDFGAVPDGQTLASAAIQAAIDACAKAGGGDVVIPRGTYLAASLEMRDNIVLRIEEGATLLGSPNMDDYRRFRQLIRARGVHNVAIVGAGRIDGQGRPGIFWEATRTREFFVAKPARPSPLILFSECDGVRVEGVTILNSPSWTIHLRGSRNIVIDHVRMDSDVAGPNTDGIDINYSENVRITNTEISTGDDAIVLKNTSAGRGIHHTRNILIADSVLTTSSYGLKLGTETMEGTFSDIVFRDSVVRSPPGKEHTMRGGVGLMCVDGADVRGIRISNIRMEGVRAPIFIRLGNRGRQQATPRPGSLRDILIENVTAVRGHDRSWASSISGLPGAYVENVVIRNLKVVTEGGGTVVAGAVPEEPEKYPDADMFGPLPAYGFYLRHARGVTLEDVSFVLQKPDARVAVVSEDVADLRMVRVVTVPAPTP